VKVALFVGDHAADGLAAHLGWWLTRKLQKGMYAGVTHCEAIHREHGDGTVTIASASLRDGGVRSKRAMLNPAHWLIVDVPQWPVALSVAFLAITDGKPYDWRGAIATCLPGSPESGAYFCNEWVAQPFVRAAATFGPHHFAAIAMSLGRDVTAEFFNDRKGMT
jgi:hypothetical protein